MKIGVTSQNFRTITGHAGKTRRFLIYEGEPGGEPREIERLDLPKEMAMHQFRGDDHPLFGLDWLITAGCGAGFIQRLAAHGVQVVVTGEQEPAQAVRKLLRGEPLAPPAPHEH